MEINYESLLDWILSPIFIYVLINFALKIEIGYFDILIYKAIFHLLTSINKGIKEANNANVTKWTGGKSFI